MIYASVYLLFFIRNLPIHLAEKIIIIQPLNFGGGITQTITERQIHQPRKTAGVGATGGRCRDRLTISRGSA